MAAGTVSIVKRPQGNILGSSTTSAIVYNNGYGVAVVSSIGHGLTTGAYIYIYSLLGSYNGYWYVEKIDANNFELREYPTASLQSFINSGSITYYTSILTHGISCLHLPIVYKLTNTLWPTNSGGTSRTVSSFANDSGYVKLTLSGSLGSFFALNYVKISGASSTSINGSFQILTKTSTSIITINLPYNAAYSFSGGTVILYYNNYKVNINVWAGLNSTHPWAMVNPYSKILSLAVIPDNTNTIKLNINDFLKVDQNIISNNLQLDTLPSNTDFFDQFYIEYQESYDQSNGTNVTTYTADLVSDQANFEGMAVNAKLPFKTRSSGYLNDYIMNGFGKFLTVFSAPVLFACQNNQGCYQDVSFINNFSKNITALTLQQTYYKGGVQQQTVNLAITQTGIGIYRVPVSYSSTNFDRVDLTLLGVFNSSSNYYTTMQQAAGNGAWTAPGSNETLVFTDSIPGAGRMIYMDSELPTGTYSVILSTYNAGNKNGSFTPVFLDASLNIISSGTAIPIATGTLIKIQTDSITINKTSRYFGLIPVFSSGGGTFDAEIAFFVNNGNDFNSVISETKTYNINSKCSDQSIMLSWLNQLGGFDYWQFNGRSTHGLDVKDVSTQNKNFFTDWPNSWGEFANTLRSESKRISFTRTLVRSQNVDKDLVDAIASIKESPLVQIVNSQYDTRTVLVDSNSFDIRKDGDKVFNISFTIVYTDPISAQEL